MKPRLRIIAGILIVTLGTIGAAVVYRWQAEPSYRGKKLSSWLDLEQRLPPPFMATPAQQEWEDALRHMGRSTLPLLVKWLDDQPWLDPQRVIAIRRVAPRFLQSPRLVLWLDRKAQENELQATQRASAAARALEALGADAQPAVPAMMRSFRHPRHWYTSYRVGEVLVGLGPLALPELLRTFSDPQFSNYIASVEVIGRMRWLGRAGAPAVPILCRHLQGPDPALRVACANALGTLHTASDITVPALAAALTNAAQKSDSALSRKCAEALGEFRDGGTTAVSALCAALDSSDGITSEEAARGLGRTGACPEIAVPALMHYLERAPRRHRKYAIEGLSGYGARAAAAAPFLREALLDEDHDTRSLAAQLLQQLPHAE